MFAFADVMHFFSNELARLCRSGLSFTFPLSGSLQSLFLRHRSLSGCQQSMVMAFKGGSERLRYRATLLTPPIRVRCGSS